MVRVHASDRAVRRRSSQNRDTRRESTTTRAARQGARRGQPARPLQEYPAWKEVRMQDGTAHPEPVVSTQFRTGRDRRAADRRLSPRAHGERRRGDRRRAAALAGLVAGAAGLMAHGRLLPPAASGSSTAPYTEQSSRPSEPGLLVAPEPASPYDVFIKEAAAMYDVSADLVRAVIQTESNFNPRAKSRAGARGLMQLTPVTLREVRMKIDPFDPRENILAGTKYLSMMLDRFDGSVPLALAGYNAGPTAVRRHRGIPPYKETRGYVTKVQKAMAAATESIADATLSD
jgi:soluble lytic murein transglycosylase-like protein